jgi:uncharacterized protein YndB with AHSA1/START domain
VWDALTNPERTKEYMFNCLAISDWKEGSALNWKGAHDDKIYVKGYILKIIPQQLLQFTAFDPSSGLEDVPSNYVSTTYTLTSKNGTTELEITDGDFSKVQNGEKRREDSEKGWAMVLPKLKEVAEK